MKLNELESKVNSAMYMDKPVAEWRTLLIDKVQVYVLGEQYLAKRFDAINYKFCNKDEAKEVLTDNLYAILRFDYFPVVSDQADNKIAEIVKSFTANLKTSLKKVSLDSHADSSKVQTIPNGTVAFRNGVFDFRKNDWLFKYEIINIQDLNNKMYSYDPKYVIMWYFDFDFEPLPFNVLEMDLIDLVDQMKEVTKVQKNYCFELMYNMSHDKSNQFSIEKFKHLCEIMGFTLLQDFSEFFVMLIGEGGNGKNSLFDGCFTPFINPRPASNNLDEIEDDKFITGALENKYHNIYLESDPKTYGKSTVLKNLTGSMYQTIQPKGINKYSGIINCKFIFSANDQEKIKFGDTTAGFKRRINMMEIYYKWDAAKEFLTRGDYYDTTFTRGVKELTDDLSNVTMFIYFAMLGVAGATNRFDNLFKFTYNDWKESYSNLDTSLKEKLENITFKDLALFVRRNDLKDDIKALLYSEDERRLYLSDAFINAGYTNYEDMVRMLNNENERIAFFSENDFYINMKLLQVLISDIHTGISFNSNIKKIYSNCSIKNLYNNKPYIKCRFEGGFLRIINTKKKGAK